MSSRPSFCRTILVQNDGTVVTKPVPLRPRPTLNLTTQQPFIGVEREIVEYLQPKTPSPEDLRSRLHQLLISLPPEPVIASLCQALEPAEDRWFPYIDHPGHKTRTSWSSLENGVFTLHLVVATIASPTIYPFGSIIRPIKPVEILLNNGKEIPAKWTATGSIEIDPKIWATVSIPTTLNYKGQIYHQ